MDSEGRSSVISNSGIYTFTFGIDGTKVQARFTYVYKKVGDEWKILSHHSSQLPTKLTPSPFTGTPHTREHVSVLFWCWVKFVSHTMQGLLLFSQPVSVLFVNSCIPDAC